MTSFFVFIKNIIKENDIEIKANVVIHSPPLKPPLEPIKNGSNILLKDTNSGVQYWQLRNWKYRGDDVYTGYYRAEGYRWHGVIKFYDHFVITAYIHNLPNALLNGQYGECFNEVSPGKHQTHFEYQPQSVNDVIFYIETALANCIHQNNESLLY